MQLGGTELRVFQNLPKFRNFFARGALRTEHLHEHSLRGPAEHALEKYARTLTPSIRDDGLDKVQRGETTVEEVLRVTRED